MERNTFNSNGNSNGTNGTNGTNGNRIQREEHQGLLIQSDNNFSFKPYDRPRNMLYYSYQGRNSGFFIPFLMCFLPFINSLMLVFVIYAINSIEQNASVLTNPNVTNTITKIEHIIDYLCESDIVKC